MWGWWLSLLFSSAQPFTLGLPVLVEWEQLRRWWEKQCGLAGTVPGGKATGLPWSHHCVFWQPFPFLWDLERETQPAQETNMGIFHYVCAWHTFCREARLLPAVLFIHFRDKCDSKSASLLGNGKKNNKYSGLQLFVILLLPELRSAD